MPNENNAFREFGRPRAPAVSRIAILRGRELGNNCRFIAENYPGLPNGQTLSILTPAEYNALRPADRPTTLIRWGTRTRVDGEAKVLNRASAIAETTDKRAFRKKAAAAGLTPAFFNSLEELGNYDGDLRDGVIVRPSHHERSENIYHCKTPDELRTAIQRCGGDGSYYISEYVKKEHEFRVFVVCGKVVMVFEKDAPRDRNQVSWGCVDEGALTCIRWSQWNMKVVENAVKAFNLSKLHFGAVDVMLKGDRAYFLEINTAPEVWPYYGERLGEAFAYHLNNDNRERIETRSFANWKDVAHPTLLA